MERVGAGKKMSTKMQNYSEEAGGTGQGSERGCSQGKRECFFFSFLRQRERVQEATPAHPDGLS